MKNLVSFIIGALLTLCWAFIITTVTLPAIGYFGIVLSYVGLAAIVQEL